MYGRTQTIAEHSVSPLKVADVMIKEAIAVDSGVTVKQAVNFMNKFEIGCLVVLNKGRVDGIVTERDILKRVIGNSRNVDNTEVKEIMSRPVWVASPTTELETALQNMLKQKIKKLPVVQDDKLVGLVTLTDIVRLQPKLLNKFKRLVKEDTPGRIQRVVEHYIS